MSPSIHLRRMMVSLSAVLSLLSAAASMPLALRVSTWSFIRLMSGDTTMVVPGNAKAGIW